MASLIDLTSLTLNPEEARAVDEAVFERVYVKGALDMFHFIATGIQMQTQIPFFGLIPMLGKLSSGCTPNAADGLDTSQKYWNPKLIDFRLTHCQGDVDQLFKLWKRSMIAANTWEDVDNEMLAFIVDRAVDAHMNAILRITSFGDTAAANVSGGGNITNGVDTGFFTMIDGLWKQIFTGVAAGDVVRYEIAENTAATKAAQLSLGATAALDAFRAMHEGIDPRAFEGGTLKYQVTRSLLNNWQTLFEDKGIANAVFDKTEDGMTRYSFRGIPIEVRHDWDRQIRTNHDLGATYYLPHRAVLTTTENIPIGTSDEQSMSDIKSFYDMKDREWYFDGASMLDCKMLEEYMISVGY